VSIKLNNIDMMQNSFDGLGVLGICADWKTKEYKSYSFVQSYMLRPNQSDSKILRNHGFMFLSLRLNS